MNEIPRVIICGSIGIDRIMNFTGSYTDLIKPEKIHALSISIFLNSLQDTHGGVGANIAYSLALLDEKPVLLGSVGHDAHFYMDDLAALGIDVTSIVYSALPTASFNVITDMDDNQVGGFYPGAMFDSDELSFLPWKDESALFVISPHDPKAMRRQVKECATWGLRFFYDVGQQVSNINGDDIRDGIEHCELLIMNDYELSVICDKTGMLESELKARVPVVVTTLGKRGSRIEGKRVPEPLLVRAAKPEGVVDPTGAGDAFRAGFLFGYIRGLDLRVCGQLGAVTAVYAVEQHGTQTHTFTLAQFETRYTQNFTGDMYGKK